MKKLIVAILFLPLFANAQTSIGPSNGSYVVIGNTQGAYQAPQTGTILHLLSSGVTSGRVSFDTYNGSNAFGSTFQGRRSGGTAIAPSAAITDYTLANFSADGYGATGFHNVSLAAMALRSEATMTDISAPTYIAFFTTPTGTIAAAERLRIKSTGTVNIAGLNSIGIVQTNVNGDLTTALLTSSQITTALGYTPISSTDTTPVKVTNTVPVSAASLPLPAGASTSALQTTGNTSLSNLDGDLGASTDATVTAAGNGSIISLLKGLQAYLASTLTTQNVNIVPTYSASFTNIAPALLATDILQIAGAAGKTIYISKIIITGTQTTAGVVNLQLIKRSTLNSGGTSATLTNVPHDGNDAAASAVVRTYSANPTTGTAIGALRSEKFYLGTATLQPQSITWTFGNGTKYPILRSATDGICLSLVGMTVAGGSISGYIEWMEL